MFSTKNYTWKIVGNVVRKMGFSTSDSHKLVALELHNSWSYIVAIELHELHTYAISHIVSCVYCNSCNSFNSTYVVETRWVTMKLQMVIVTQKPNCKTNCESPYFS
jgi:hypothetical protein